MPLEEKNRKVKTVHKSHKVKDKQRNKSKEKLRKHLGKVSKTELRRNLEGKRFKQIDREQYIIEIKAHRDHLREKLKNKDYKPHSYQYYYWYYYWLNKFAKNY